MHRTETKDPQFGPIVYGEIWVRVREDDDHYRHFHVAPPTDSTGSMDRMSVEQAVAAVQRFNEAEREQVHLFDYYAVRVETQRTMLGEI